MNDSLEKDLIKKFDLKLNVDLQKYSTMSLKAIGNIITIKDLDSLKELTIFLNKNKIKFNMIGFGANQLLPESYDGVYVKLDFPFEKSIFDEIHDSYLLPASLSLHHLSAHAVKNGLKGWEVFTGIPATLGGAVFMNAGTNLGEIGELVKEVHIVTPDGDIRVHKVDSKSFSYRENHFLNPGEIIYQVEITHQGIDLSVSRKIREYLDLRTKSQPLKEKTCGCIFKNNLTTKDGILISCRAGKFIDIMGLKGFCGSHVKISEKHGNFMVNTGGASLSDLKTFIQIVQDELKLQYGVDFETEVKF